MKRYTYGVFFGSKWARSTNKRQAIQFAKDNGGYVKAIPGGLGAMDAPTFLVMSEIIADFRNGIEEVAA